MKEKRLTFTFIGERPEHWKYFSHFFFTPAFATFTQNIYQYGNKWMYQRVFVFYIFFWEFSIDWKYGKVEDRK